jgi:hypothetical protein
MPRYHVTDGHYGEWETTAPSKLAAARAFVKDWDCDPPLTEPVWITVAVRRLLKGVPEKNSQTFTVRIAPSKKGRK